MKSGKNNRHSSRRSISARQSSRKKKKTFSLSPEALAYLDLLAKKHRSASEALDTLIREKRETAEKERIAASIRQYYDSISDEERAENRAWGEFVLAQLKE